MTRTIRRKPPTKRYPLKLTGDLALFHVVMSAMTARELIQLNSGEMSEGAAIALVASKVVEHDFDIPELLDLDADVLLRISVAWAAAIRDAALPPEPGNS